MPPKSQFYPNPTRFTIAGIPAEEYDCLPSTSTLLKQRATASQTDLVVIALSQTGGRGRLGRSFFSAPGGLYMSVLLRGLPMGFHRYITPAAAVAVSEALEALGSDFAGIKWVNDIYIHDKKVCGILAETVSACPDAAIVGIGINISEPPGGFPDDIKNRAGAAFSGACPELRLALAEKIVNNLKHEIPEQPDLAARYRQRSILLGRDVQVLRPEQPPQPAKVLDIDDDFQLVVEAGGKILRLFSGDVSLKV